MITTQSLGSVYSECIIPMDNVKENCCWKFFLYIMSFKIQILLHIRFVCVDILLSHVYDLVIYTQIN